jgi:polyphosphate kinase
MTRGTAIGAASVAAGLALAAAPAAGHPHIFIDTGLEIIFDDRGRAAAVRVAWVYDDFYSMLMLGDRGLDPDGDGRLTAEEEAVLSGFDMAWDADYEGDLYALDGAGRPVALGRPRDWSARMLDGRIVSTHLRLFEPPLERAALPLVLQVYDPGYYTAYTILGTPRLTGGEGCEVKVYEPDLTAAEEALKEALAEYTADQDVEYDYPAVGAAFAEEARVTCAGG